MSEIRVRKERIKLFVKLWNVMENCSHEDWPLKKARITW